MEVLGKHRGPDVCPLEVSTTICRGEIENGCLIHTDCEQTQPLLFEKKLPILHSETICAAVQFEPGDLRAFSLLPGHVYMGGVLKSAAQKVMICASYCHVTIVVSWLSTRVHSFTKVMRI